MRSAALKSRTSMAVRSAFAQRHALQLDRQRGDRAIDVLEGGLRVRPFAEAGIGDRAPDRRIELVADHGLDRSLSASSGRSQQIGDRLEHGAGHVVVAFGSARTTSSTRLGLRRHVAGEIEPRQIEPRVLRVLSGAMAAIRISSASARCIWPDGCNSRPGRRSSRRGRRWRLPGRSPSATATARPDG